MEPLLCAHHMGPADAGINDRQETETPGKARQTTKKVSLVVQSALKHMQWGGSAQI